ncbi:hypothetical protein [Halorussus halobius]|uniref:hypothetical protein n=1 Tax=Halorussus halobius TaxID=1710537 RepID=UPI00109266B8|nr:hypothetical protein [Halorussus halobius]
MSEAASRTFAQLHAFERDLLYAVRALERDGVPGARTRAGPAVGIPIASSVSRFERARRRAESLGLSAPLGREQ